MEKIFIYEIDRQNNSQMPVIKEIEAFKSLNPINQKEFYLILEDEYLSAYYLKELQNDDYFLTKNEAYEQLRNEKKEEIDFFNLCIDFKEKCNQMNKDNPFEEIGEYRVVKQNENVINELTDPVYKQFLKYKLRCHPNLSEFTRKLVD